MFNIEKIYEKPGILDFLEKRNLTSQYIKSAKYILNGYFGNKGSSKLLIKKEIDKK